jgi:hypothetical protein
MVNLSKALPIIYQDMTALIDYRMRPRFDTGTGEVPQVMYPLFIQSRLAARRSWNELLEIAIRDPLGALSWLWGIPIGQKLYIANFVKPEIRELLIARNDIKLPPKANLWQRAKVALNNSPMWWGLEPSSSLKHRIDQLKRIEGKMTNPEMVQKTLKLLEEAKIQRDLATFLGFMITFAILGVGINIFNITNTKKSVEAQKARQSGLQRLA